MESKPNAMDRLRREHRWRQASAYHEEQRQLLRQEGRTRKEACELAWQRMTEVFSPLYPAWPFDISREEAERQLRMMPATSDDESDARFLQRCENACQQVRPHMVRNLQPKDAPSARAWEMLVEACERRHVEQLDFLHHTELRFSANSVESEWTSESKVAIVFGSSKPP